MTDSIDSRATILLDELETYNFNKSKLSMGLEDLINLRIEMDALNKEASALRGCMMADELTDKIVDKFEKHLTEFRNNITMSILSKDGTVQRLNQQPRT